MSLGLALAGVPAWATGTAHPGTVNYIEGQVSVNGQPVSQNQIGSVDVNPNGVIETGQGKAEILLTPGVFLRMGDNSAIRMISPGLTDTRVAVLQGHALLEVTELLKQNNLNVVDDDTTTHVLKHGLYEFAANPAQVAAYEGEAEVTGPNKDVTVKKGKEVQLSGTLQTQKFDRNEHDALYNWSSARSQYVADASMQSARTIVVNNGFWGGPGWYWNSAFGFYDFMPGYGYLASPFGWGFYSPVYFWGGPGYVYRGYRGPLYSGYVARRPFVAASPAFRSSFSGHAAFARGRR
jgi:hypothetical protein